MILIGHFNGEVETPSSLLVDFSVAVETYQ